MQQLPLNDCGMLSDKSDAILAALSSLGWLRHASRLGAAGLLDDTEFCGSLDQLATLVKATLAYQSATAGPKPPEPLFSEPPPHRRSSAPNIMSGPWPARSLNSAAAEDHPPRVERRNSLERISENMPGRTDEMSSFSEMGLALHSSASPSASPSPSPSPSGSPSTQRRNSSSSLPPTKWSLWQKTEPSPSSSPCETPKRRRSLGGRQRGTSSEGALSGRDPAQPLVCDAVAPHYAEAKVNECAHQVLCKAGEIEQPPAARLKRTSREHLARNMKRASGETLTGAGG